MRILLSTLILATLLLASCNGGGSAAKLPAGWPVAGMQLPADAELTEPIPALKMGQVFMSVADGDETSYSETVAFYSDNDFNSVASGMEQALKAEGYWALPPMNGQALSIRGYISGSDDSFVTIMYTPLKQMFAVQAVQTAAASTKLRERREQEGTAL
ncbi:hypothetical protein KDL44_02845 [bacterium]|nr:hypothetical protein [bacterium]